MPDPTENAPPPRRQRRDPAVVVFMLVMGALLFADGGTEDVWFRLVGVVVWLVMLVVLIREGVA